MSRGCSPMNDPRIALRDGMPEYGDSYIDWKGQSRESFGQLSPRDRATFDREMRALLGAGAEQKLRVLELGFGLGSFLAYARERGWEVTGTEVADELVASGQRAGFDTIPASDLAAVAPATFDLIAGFDVIEHIPPSDVIPLFALLRRLLRPGGVIFLRYPNADSWLGNQNFYGDPTHVNAMGHFKLDYFCQRSGLTIAALRPEARLGFDGGVAKGVHALVAGPLIRLIAAITKFLYFPRSRIVLGSANVVAHLRAAPSNDSGMR